MADADSKTEPTPDGATPSSTGAPIVVGIDRSPDAERALRWAAGEARQRGVPLHVLFAANGIGVELARESGWAKAVTYDMEEKAALEVIDKTVANVLGDVSGLEVVPVVAEETAVASLLEASKTAGLLVVGSRGRGGFDGLMLGSVGLQCAMHAHCPVVVVRGDDQYR
jgi:nucleotide-binding universal stress UspA family protein